jgi:vacuolar protein sorting-associated protein 13A/C
LSILSWKGREASWQRRYLCLVGPFIYVLESPGSKSYKKYTRSDFNSCNLAMVVGSKD